MTFDREMIEFLEQSAHLKGQGFQCWLLSVHPCGRVRTVRGIDVARHRTLQCPAKILAVNAAGFTHETVTLYVHSCQYFSMARTGAWSGCLGPTN